MYPSISVVIPAYNYGRFIGAAIESVVKQTHPASEIIVVDNGSTDDTREVVAKFGDAVRYLYQENFGVSVARNRGVDQSTGDLIAFLDADDYWEPTCLERAIAKFEQPEKIGLVHWGLREFDSSTGETIRFYLEGSDENVAENLLVWEGPTIAGHGAVIVTREAFFDAGGFDTETEPSEDWDFCYRLTRKHNVAFVPEPLVNYRAHPTSAHRDIRKFERGMERFFEKAFATDDESILALRRKAFGNFHSVMAGSYFHVGEYRRSISHALRSVMMRPSKIGYFLMFPFRRFGARRRDRESSRV